MQLGLGLLGLILAAALMVSVAVLIAVNPRPLVEGAVRLIPGPQRPLARDVLQRIHDAWLRWLIAVGLDMLVLGTLLFIGLELVGLRFALGFALFSAFPHRHPQLRLDHQRDPARRRRARLVADRGAARADRLPRR